MRFYLANPSRHDVVFNFRIPEIAKALSQPIKIGQQVCLVGKDLNPAQIQSLVEQVTTYGGCRSGEYGNVRAVIPYVYQIGALVSADEIRRVMRHNNGELVNLGKKAREEAAIATNAAMEQMTPGAVAELEVTVQEEKPSPDGGEQLAEGVIVSNRPDRQNDKRRRNR